MNICPHIFTDVQILYLSLKMSELFGPLSMSFGGKLRKLGIGGLEPNPAEPEMNFDY